MTAKDSKEIESRPDGWDRFENAIDAAIQNGPKHRPKTDAESSPKKATTSKPKKGA